MDNKRYDYLGEDLEEVAIVVVVDQDAELLDLSRVSLRAVSSRSHVATDLLHVLDDLDLGRLQAEGEIGVVGLGWSEEVDAAGLQGGNLRAVGQVVVST